MNGWLGEWMKDSKVEEMGNSLLDMWMKDSKAERIDEWFAR